MWLNVWTKVVVKKICGQSCSKCWREGCRNYWKCGQNNRKVVDNGYKEVGRPRDYKGQVVDKIVDKVWTEMRTKVLYE